MLNVINIIKDMRFSMSTLAKNYKSLPNAF